MKARQKGAKKRSLHSVNEHFERLFNAASAALGINQGFLNTQSAGCRKCKALRQPITTPRFY